jgi:hypothetical protein
MKIINLNESQFGRLFEGLENFGEDSVPEYNKPGENKTTSKITKNGDIIDSDQLAATKLPKEATPQQWGGRNSLKAI